MSTNVISAIIAARLPSRYEPLLLNFYGDSVRESGNLIIFGDDYGTNICLKLEDGCIYSVDQENELPTRFVNTSVELLAPCLLAHRRYASDVTKSHSEGEQLQAVSKLREELISIDSKVFTNPENWWAVALEQIGDGLL
jgi:hypothetical protein